WNASRATSFRSSSAGPPRTGASPSPDMLLNPQFLAEQVLNSLQFSMLLFLLAIGLSVVFGLMDYLNLSHGTIYMFAAYVAFSISQLGGSFWAALAIAPLVAAAVGLVLYLLPLKRAEGLGHLTEVV